MDNTFKFIPLNAESSSCEVTPPPHGIPKKNKRKIPQANVSKKPTAKIAKNISVHTPIVKKPAANKTGSGELIAGGILALGTGLSLIPHPASQVGGRLLIAGSRLLTLGGAALTAGCIDISAKPKPPLPPYPDYYPGDPSNTGGTIGLNTGGGSSPVSTTPAPVPTKETPAPSSSPWPLITPGPGEIPDNSLEFDPANLETSTIDASKLSQIKTDSANMKNSLDAWNFFTKYKGLLALLIKEQSLMEGFQKALKLSGFSSVNEIEISKALVNYYLKYNFLIEDPSKNTLDWQIFESSFTSLKNRAPQDADNILDGFIKFSAPGNYSSLPLLEKLLEKYVSLLESTGNTAKLIQKIKSEYPAEIIIESSELKASDLSNSNVITLLGSISTLPGAFYRGLVKIKLTGTEEGHYVRGGVSIAVNSSMSYYTIHEIAHYYDSRVSSPNLSRLYRQISWDGIKSTSDDKSKDFVTDYGDYASSNYWEDFATALDSYVRYASKLRATIRAQFNQGQFDLAAKYLFIKYFTPFKGKEFFTDVEPPLRAKEVSDAIQAYKARTGKDASPQVMAIINSISH